VSTYTIGLYYKYKELYESVKPLRGKTEDIRPFGNRRRTHERICIRPQPDGTTAYAARLYDTDVVTVYPDSTFDVTDGGWTTSTSAAFISVALRTVNVYASKVRNKVWVYDHKTPTKFPVGKEPLRLCADPVLTPVDADYTMQVKVMDRKATAEVYAKMQPFFDWMTTFLKMSDGWLMHDTRKQMLGIDTEKRAYAMPVQAPSGAYPPPELALWQQSRFNTNWVLNNAENRKKLLDWFCNLHPDDYLFTFCLIAYSPHDGSRYQQEDDTRRVAEKTKSSYMGRDFPIHYYDTKQDIARIKREIQKIIKHEDSFKKIVDKKPDSKIRQSIV
jgi:hypothetical protein